MLTCTPVQCDAGASDDMEEAVCEAGGIPALLKLLAACTQQPQQGGRCGEAAAADPQELLHPAVIALVNLAAGNPRNRDAIRQAGGIPLLVPLLMVGRCLNRPLVCLTCDPCSW